MAEPDTTDQERVMSDYTALWNGDFSKLDVVAESVEVHHHAAPGGVVRGREALEAFIREFHSAFPDFRITVDDWIGGDGVAMKEWTMTGTHEGRFNDIPPTGREIESRGMARVVIAEGRVQEDRLYYNPQLMAEQLGIAEG
jgi:steroid delta-isomerase-like uncharacterized protein